MREVWVERRKWPATPHYGHPGWILGDDEWGRWIEIRQGSPWYRGDELLFHLPWHGVLLAQPGAGWLAWFIRGEVEVDLYVDIVAEVSSTDAAVVAVDLDLDILRMNDGTIKLVDEDEFAEHQVTLGYPDALVAHARREAKSVLGAVHAGSEPFAGIAATGWLDALSR